MSISGVPLHLQMVTSNKPIIFITTPTAPTKKTAGKRNICGDEIKLLLFSTENSDVPLKGAETSADK